MGVQIQEKNGYLHLIVRQRGRKPVWRALGLKLTGDRELDKDIRNLAEVQKARAALRLATGEWGEVDPVGGKTTFVAYAEGLAAKQSPHNHLPHSLKYVRGYFQERRLEAIEEVALEGYKEYLLAQETLALSTASHYLAAAKAVLRRAFRDRLIVRYPGDRVTGIKAPEPVIGYLTDEELAALAAHPLTSRRGAEICRAFLFGCMVGLRKSDLYSLTWGHIQRGPNPRILKTQKKTRAVVGVPINASAWDLIKDDRIHRAGDLVFPILAESLTDSGYYFKSWRVRAGIEKRVGWHTSRHTCATLLLEHGAGIRTVQDILGHDKIQTTLKYAKATDKLKREAVDALNEVRLSRTTTN